MDIIYNQKIYIQISLNVSLRIGIVRAISTHKRTYITTLKHKSTGITGSIIAQVSHKKVINKDLKFLK